MITLRQGLQYQPHQASWFVATAALFNRVAAFYFEVIQAHEQVLELSSKEALTALEQLTHRTGANPHPVVPLSEIAQEVPAMFRRAPTRAAAFLEQVRHALRGHVEGSHGVQPRHQGVDGFVLELAESPLQRERPSRRARCGQSLARPAWQPLVAAYPGREAVHHSAENRAASYRASRNEDLCCRPESRRADCRVYRSNCRRYDPAHPFHRGWS
jgi:hypothetical protein